MDVKTRGQKKMIGQPLLDDPKAILNNIGENQAEAQELVEDRIFHDFVEVTFQLFYTFDCLELLMSITQCGDFHDFSITNLIRKINFWGF